MEMQALRRNIEANLISMHPYVQAQIEYWEEHEKVKFAGFGHHRYSSSVSIASQAEMSREQAQQEISRCRRRNT